MTNLLDKVTQCFKPQELKMERGEAAAERYGKWVEAMAEDPEHSAAPTGQIKPTSAGSLTRVHDNPAFEHSVNSVCSATTESDSAATDIMPTQGLDLLDIKKITKSPPQPDTLGRIAAGEEEQFPVPEGAANKLGNLLKEREGVSKIINKPEES